jgi:hypothetical protein
MAQFVFTGSVDEANARLKKSLEANDARFHASLNALFKSTPPRKPAAPAASAAPATGPHGSAGWGLSRKAAGAPGSLPRAARRMP